MTLILLFLLAYEPIDLLDDETYWIIETHCDAITLTCEV